MDKDEVKANVREIVTDIICAYYGKIDFPEDGDEYVQEILSLIAKAELRARIDEINRVRNDKYKAWDWKELAYRLDDREADLTKQLEGKDG